MKMNFIALFTFILFAGISCQEKIDMEKEKEAIKTVIEEVTDAWLTRDFDRLAFTFVQDEFATRLRTGKNGYLYSAGWEEIGQLYKESIKNNPNPITNKEVKTNYKIKVYKESAWAVFDNEVYNSEGELMQKRVHVDFLEKVDGSWKIAYLSIVGTSSYDDVEKNKQTSAKYHKLDPEDINDILTDDFIGRLPEISGYTWDKEKHKNYWTNNRGKATDTIYHQIADGNWVATRFQRKMNVKGKDVEIESMHFKRFENGKIAEIWQFANSKLYD